MSRVKLPRRDFLAAGALFAVTALAASAKTTRKAIMANTEAEKKVVRDFIQTVWTERRLAALPEFWTADCVNHAMPPGMDNRGLTMLHAYHEQFFAAFAAFSDIRIEIDQQVAEADKVVTQMTTRARHTGAFMGHAPTGKVVTLETIRIDRLEIDRLEAGKIAEHWSVADMAGLMQQLGG